MHISCKKFNLAYSDFKRNAIKDFGKRNFESSLKNIETCAQIAYLLNIFYTDNELDAVLAKNALAINGGKCSDFHPVKGRYVLIDTNGSDNHGLSQQYIRALIHAEVEFVYIYLESDHARAKFIFEEVNSYAKAQILTFEPTHSNTQKVNIIMQFLADYKPEKYLMHIMPWDVVATMVCSLLKNVTTYNINATDHAFWIGASFIDYLIEFRSYGYSVSLDKRGLKADQLLLLPYYPIINDIPFKGFPATIPPDAIKIFSGGSFYKIYGENEQYFKIVKRILSDNPNAVLLFAGTGDDRKMRQFITENKLTDRILLLGNRNDIYNVFKNCDIYLGTYPITGGLMSQYAAICSKPILTYTDANLPINYVEGIVCHMCDCQISFTDINDFYDYAKKLCGSRQLIASEGERLANCVISPDEFNKELKYILDHDKTQRKFVYEHINYERFSKVYLEVENYSLRNVQKIVVSKLKFRSIYKHPGMVINLATTVLNKLFKKNK